jgi:hypothetical protein
MNTKTKFLKTILGILLLFLSANGNAQNLPFWDDIQTFKKQDSIAMPSQYKTLFIGSSSFTIWKTLDKDLPEYAPLNRAFGGSALLDVIRYRKDIIDKYNPEKIIIYCGENDIASSDTVTGKIVLNRFKELHSHIREKFPTINIYYISIKPSPSRWSMKERMIDANRQIKKYCKKQKNTDYLSIWSQMLRNAKPNPSLFLKDSLHMNKKGYEIWIKEIRKKIKN